MKQKTDQQTSIDKLEEIINKMQTNINNLHENITKLKNDTEIAKSKMFSYENISQKKFEFLDTGSHSENIKFYNGQNNNKPKRNPEDLKPGKKSKASSNQSVFYVLKLVEKCFYYKNAFLAI